MYGKVEKVVIALAIGAILALIVVNIPNSEDSAKHWKKTPIVHCVSAFPDGYDCYEVQQ